MNDRLLTAEDVAELIGMKVDYVYALSRRGEIPHLRFGWTLRYRAEAIDEWLRERERSDNGRRRG
jgi:excisionase family DNA binding protein